MLLEMRAICKISQKDLDKSSVSDVPPKLRLYQLLWDRLFQ